MTEERRHSPDVQLAILATQMTNLAAAVAAIDAKVDTLDHKMQRAEGVLSVVRWLGVGGVSIATVALLRAFGVHFI